MKLTVLRISVILRTSGKTLKACTWEPWRQVTKYRKCIDSHGAWEKRFGDFFDGILRYGDESVIVGLDIVSVDY
jgi:hypothetical protein